jgi:hypothetical protein
MSLLRLAETVLDRCLPKSSMYGFATVRPGERKLGKAVVSNVICSLLHFQVGEDRGTSLCSPPLTVPAILSWAEIQNCVSSLEERLNVEIGQFGQTLELGLGFPSFAPYLLSARCLLLPLGWEEGIEDITEPGPDTKFQVVHVSLPEICRAAKGRAIIEGEDPKEVNFLFAVPFHPHFSSLHVFT